jgi:hypothetical protein
MKKAAPPKLQKLPAAKQRRLHKLLDKNSEGTITPKEKALLERLVADAEELMIANAKRLAKFSRSEGPVPPPMPCPSPFGFSPSARTGDAWLRRKHIESSLRPARVAPVSIADFYRSLLVSRFTSNIFSHALVAARP